MTATQTIDRTDRQPIRPTDKQQRKFIFYSYQNENKKTRVLAIRTRVKHENVEEKEMSFILNFEKICPSACLSARLFDEMFICFVYFYFLLFKIRTN